MIDASKAWEEVNKLVSICVLPPDGWKCSTQLAREWKCDRRKAAAQADALCESQIMVKRQFKGPNNLPTWFYAPARMAVKRYKRPAGAFSGSWRDGDSFLADRAALEA